MQVYRRTRLKFIVFLAASALFAGVTVTATAQPELGPDQHCQRGHALAVANAFYPLIFNGDPTQEFNPAETALLCQFRIFAEPPEEICFCEDAEAIYTGNVPSFTSTDSGELQLAREDLGRLSSVLSIVWGPEDAQVENISIPVKGRRGEATEDGPLRTVWTQLGGLITNLVPGSYEVELQYFYEGFGLYRTDINHFRVLQHEMAHDLGRPDHGFQGSVVCPQEVACADGQDNDGDLATDCLDTNCEFLLGCLSGAFIDLGSAINADAETPVYEGDTSALDSDGNHLSTDDYVLRCTFLAGDAADDEFSWTAPGDGTYTFDTLGSALDTVLGVSTESEFTCHEDLDNVIWQSTVTLALESGDEVVIIVDGFGDDEGSYELNITEE